MDLDYFDMCEHPYKQLVVWNPDDEEIIGGYRYLPGNEVEIDETGQPILATSHMFHFSDNFMENYMAQTIELGRSFVTLEYQNTRRTAAKSLFALDNLWDGLGALTVVMPNLKYFFGKMTMFIGATDVSLEMNKKIKIARIGKATNEEEQIIASPVKNREVPLSNPQQGFASFLIPAILVLVMQQTLLLGIGMNNNEAEGLGKNDDEIR